MSARRPLGLSSIVLGCVVAITALLGPWGFDVIRYRASTTALNQIVGADLAAFVVVAPVAVIAGILVLRRHPAGPMLALAPSVFVVYTYAQLVVGAGVPAAAGQQRTLLPVAAGRFHPGRRHGVGSLAQH